MVQSESTSGTLPSTIMRARPSAMAVLPTPASPTYSGIVLAPAAQDLDGALHLERAPDQRIDLAVLGELVEVRGVLVERAAASRLAIALVAGLFLGGFFLGDLRQAV